MFAPVYGGPLDGELLDVGIKESETILLTISIRSWGTDGACWKYDPKARSRVAAYCLLEGSLVFVWMEKR